jgi:cobalt-zinc-cadmium resistance protein CzcA
VVSALVGALAVSFTLIPVLAFFGLRGAGLERESPLTRWARKAYVHALDFVLERPIPVFILALGTLLSAFLLVPRLGSEFLPELNEGALYVIFTLPGNMSLAEAQKLTPRLKRLIMRTPEAKSVLTQLGRPEDGTDPSLPNNLEAFVKLSPPEEWRSNKPTLNDIVSEMAFNLSQVPGLEANFSQPIRDNVAENISGQFGQIALKIYGEDLGELQRAAEHSKDALAQVPGVADLGIVKSSESPQIAVKLDRDALGRFDLDLDDVQDYIETAMAGHVASELWEGEKRSTSPCVCRAPHAKISTRSAIFACRSKRA